MSRLYLLDTNILIRHVRRDELAQNLEQQYGLLVTEMIPLISAVSVAEVRSFARRREWGEPRMTQLRFLLTMFRRVEIQSAGIEDAYVTLDVYSHSVGVTMGKNDLWIAATALVSGATLLTTDQDFDHLAGTFLDRRWIDSLTNHHGTS